MFGYFTIKFHFSFFASCRFKFFASLPFGNFRLEAKRSEAKLKSIFSFLFAFICFFRFFSLFFALNFLLRFDLVIFASKRKEGENLFASKEAKFNIFALFRFPIPFQEKTFLTIFSLSFCFA